MPGEVIARFSSRRGQVLGHFERLLAEWTAVHGRSPTRAERAGMLDDAAVRSRSAKRKGSETDLHTHWRAQLTAGEQTAIDSVAGCQLATNGGRMPAGSAQLTWKITVESSVVAGAWVSPKKQPTSTLHNRTGSRSSTASGPGPHTRRWSLTAPTALAGASSDRLGRFRASRIARNTTSSSMADRLADRLLLRRQGPSPPGSRGRCARRGPRTDRQSRRRHGRGLPGARRRCAGRLPLPRCALDLRTCRVPPGPQDRQAPLGRQRPSDTGLTAVTSPVANAYTTIFH